MSIERDIIKLYDSNLRALYTIRAIATKLNHAYPYVHRTIQKLLQVGALRAVPIGGSRCISIDLHNRRAILYLTEIELEKRNHLPQETQALAAKLDRDGTITIQTVVAGNDAIYVVGEGAYPGTTTISRETFIELLRTTSLFKTHVVLYGYERFFSIIAANQHLLDETYHPLLLATPHGGAV